MNSFIIKQSIFINKSKEEVWNFTQDYNNRPNWDNSVIEATVIQSLPNRIVKLKMKGNTIMTFEYKLDDKPNKTSLVARKIKSPLIEKAGGSWSYEDLKGGTLWKQTNSIEIKDKFFLRLVKPFLKTFIQLQTRQAMTRAKKMLEAL